MESANECCRAAKTKLDEAGGSPTKLLQKQFLAALRDRALLALLIATGLRIAEALGICLEDFDDVEQTILIRGKGKKLRKVFFDLDVLQEHLLPYLEARKALDLPHDRLFVSSKSYAPLGSRGVQKRLKNYLRAAGLRTSASPHTLRHSFATVAIEKGANIKAVSQIMGHSSCRITIDLYTPSVERAPARRDAALQPAVNRGNPHRRADRDAQAAPGLSGGHRDSPNRPVMADLLPAGRTA